MPRGEVCAGQPRLLPPTLLPRRNDMDVVRLDGDVQNLAPDAFCRLAQKGFQAWYDWPDKHLSSPCRYPHEVVVKQRNAGTLMSILLTHLLPLN